MTQSAPAYATLDEWIAREAILFSVDSPASFNAAVDKVVRSLGEGVEVLGYGEAMHGSEDFPNFRNRLFQRLVEVHGFTAIAIECSFPRGRVVDDYVAGRGTASYDDVQDVGFSHKFGQLESTRALVEWMRAYNADPKHDVKLRFYGFDSPTEMVGTDSPRHVLQFVLDYLASTGGARAESRQQRIDELIGDDAAWENPAASFDPTKSIGQSPDANALRLETEELISELQRRRPELTDKNGADGYLEATHYAVVARQLLNYHAAIARTSDDRIAECLGIRDAMMADNLAYMATRERGRGKVLAFAHNSHLQRGIARWQLGPHALAWWPAGGHLHHMLGPRYAAIGSAVGASAAQGVGHPEAGSLEGRLAAAGTALFVPTHQVQGLPSAEIAAMPTRSGSAQNPGYFPLTAQSLADFDWLLFM